MLSNSKRANSLECETTDRSETVKKLKLRWSIYGLK
jgi:hypothetical protein